MKFSDNYTSVAKALIAAQKQMTFAAADKENKHLKSKYADLASVIEAVKKPLNDNGLLFIQSPGMLEGKEYALMLTTKIIHVESGEWVENTSVIPLAKSDPQGYGSALTYARRYNLSALVGLYNEDDDAQIATDRQRKAESEGTEQSAEPEKSAQPAALPDYTEAQFDGNKAKWKEAIDEGRATADALINTISTKFTLSEKQKEAIRSMKPIKQKEAA